jgi:hypothetical protein
MSEGSIVPSPIDAPSHAGRRRALVRVPRCIRFTTTEWATIVEHARACGKPYATYVRAMSVGAAPALRRGHADAALIRELGRVGTTLVGLSATVREGGAVALASAVDATLAELLAVVRRIG